MPPIGGIMKRAQVFSGVEPALSEASMRGKEDLSRFAPKSESRLRLWTTAEKKIARLLDSIRTGREARTQSRINRRTLLLIETELATTSDRADVELSTDRPK